jgi:hypothetical protein
LETKDKIDKIITVVRDEEIKEVSVDVESESDLEISVESDSTKPIQQCDIICDKVM